MLALDLPASISPGNGTLTLTCSDPLNLIATASSTPQSITIGTGAASSVTITSVLGGALREDR